MFPEADNSGPDARFAPTEITRPDPALMRYYILCSLLSGPFFPFVLIPLAAKYATMRYRFDDRGVSMSWGLLFRREIYLTFRRIQDIHLTRNIVQRWMGLSTIGVQTASGSSTPEMSIEGILNADSLRDYLYAQMRGVKGTPSEDFDESVKRPDSDEALVLLREIRDSLKKMVERQGARHD